MRLIIKIFILSRYDQWLDVSHLPHAPVTRVRCIGRGIVKIVVAGNDLVRENVLHCPADELSKTTGLPVREEFGMDSIVYFPFLVVVGDLDDWQVSGTVSSLVDPAACTSLAVFRWGIDQLRDEIDYQNLYFIEVDDSSFESEEGVNVVDGHLSFHADTFGVNVLDNTLSSSPVSMYTSAFSFNKDFRYCSGSASSVDAGELLVDPMSCSAFFMIADSGATSNLFPNRKLFTVFLSTDSWKLCDLSQQTTCS